MASDREPHPSPVPSPRALFDHNAAALVLYARTWLSAADAEDAVQEAFTRLMALEPARPAEPRAWLFRVVRNLAITRLRRLKTSARIRRDSHDPLVIPNAHTLADAAEVNRALHDLPEDEREALVLRLWGDWTLEEIGQLTETSTATAFRNYQRALSAIRARLEKPCTTKPTQTTKN